MTFVIGMVIVFGCLLGGFAAMGGHIAVLWQPFEYIIILGSSIGTFFVANPMKVVKDTVKAIMELKVGEALVSMLDEKGMPAMVSRSFIAPPSARVGPVTPDELKGVMAKDPIKGKYDTPIDRESAFEILAKRAGGQMDDAGAPTVEADAGSGGILSEIGNAIGGALGSGPAQINPKTGKPMRVPKTMT